MRDITLSDLDKIAGRSRAAMRGKIVRAINKYKAEFDCDTPERMALFLAHTAVESGWFKKMEEGMSYSAGRLRKVWPRRFKTNAIARKYARNPQKLANYVYGGRMGNKGKSNAGWLYRGSGLGQTTGYNNFLEFERETGIPVTQNPDILRDPDQGTRAAFVFWQKRNMNHFAAMGTAGVRPSRKVWNGGYNHLKEVRACYAKAVRALGSGKKTPSRTPLRNENVNMLKQGNKGPQVRRLQEALIALDFMRPPADGDFGPNTKRSVMNFQHQNNLKTDGVAGPDTLTALIAAKNALIIREKSKGLKNLEVMEEVAAPDRVSTTKASAGAVGLLGSGTVVSQVAEIANTADTVSMTTDSVKSLAWSVGPWLFGGLVLMGLGWYIWTQREGIRQKMLKALNK